MKNKLLWLDDYRDPYQNLERKVPPQFDEKDIVWVKNYNEFVRWIEENGLPGYVSFDHDLAPEHYVPKEYWDDYEKNRAYQDEQVYEEETGEGCAKWMCEYCLQELLPIPKFWVHSANPVGAANIRRVMWKYFNIWKRKKDNVS